MIEIDFKNFLSVWNNMQNQTTPRVHLRIAHWLETSWRNGDRRLLLMAFRSCGKSTIVGLFAAWLLYRRPDLRILVLAADSMLARKMVRNVKRIIERHPLTEGLKPEKPDQWGSDRFTIKRPLELRDPSMLARGITSNITGSRADIIICDDVEVPVTCDTAGKREELRELLGETDFVRVPGGTQLYVGTPHSWFTIYANAARTEINEAIPFLDGYSRLEIPVIENGISAWPERFPPEEIDSIHLRSGPNRFRSQMLLQPVNIAEGRLDPGLLVRYGGDLGLSPELKGLYLHISPSLREGGGGRVHEPLSLSADSPYTPTPTLPLGGRGLIRMVSASAWWDPSFAKGGDSSVLAIVFTDEEGRRYLHNVTYLSVKPDHLSPPACGRGDQGGREFLNSNLDNATAQCRQAALTLKRFHCPSVAIETNGLGQFLPSILRRELARAHVPCAVVEKTSTRAKDIRILEAFDVVLAARLLHAHDSVYATPFLTEMQEWRPGGKGRDDGLDAVAGALSLEPVRVKRLSSVMRRQGWTSASETHTADTRFDV